MESLPVVEVATPPTPLYSYIAAAVFIIIIGQIAFFLAKKTTLRLRPRIVSHIPRAEAETCLWLQRLLNSVFSISVNKGYDGTDSKTVSLLGKLQDSLEDKGWAHRVKISLSPGVSPPRILAVVVRPQGPKSQGASKQVEVDFEVEYNGGATLGLTCDLPIVRGKALPLSVSVSNVSLTAHCRLLLSHMDLPAGVNNLQLQLSFLSEPCLECKFETAIGAKFRLRNWFMFPVILRFLLSRIIKKSMMAPSSIKSTIELPGTLDVGIPWRSTPEESETSSISPFIR